MMDFISPYLKNGWLDPAFRWAIAFFLYAMAAVAVAQTPLEPSVLKVERSESDVLLSAQVQFELPAAVEDALQKGVPLFFVAEADILRERWYWADKRVVGVERHLRLAYQPLTRRWRLTVTTGAAKGGALGLALNQYFNTLPEALAIIKRVSRWQIAEVSELDSAVKYRVEFRFKLDLAQLPLPFQIGTLGQSDWNVAQTLGVSLNLDPAK
jgi:hypothetical protein